MEISIRLSQLSAQRMWEHEKPLPKGMQLSTSFSLAEVRREGERVVVSFSVLIQYLPSVAQLSLSGKAVLTGEEEELGKVVEAYERRKPPPVELLQPLMGVVLAEAILLARSLNLPSPLPLPVLRPGPEEEKPSYVG